MAAAVTGAVIVILAVSAPGGRDGAREPAARLARRQRRGRADAGHCCRRRPAHPDRPGDWAAAIGRRAVARRPIKAYDFRISF
jgi:hypothetical protein